MPYIGYETYNMRNEIKNTLKNILNHVEFRFVFTNPNKISSFFKFKDDIPIDARSCVVYEYNCSGCNARYIGSSRRSFRTRRHEHIGISIHTGRPISNPSFSNIRNHSEEHDHPLLHSNFRIVKTAPNPLSLLIAESIIIKQSKPSLNSNLASFKLNII